MEGKTIRLNRMFDNKKAVFAALVNSMYLGPQPGITSDSEFRRILLELSNNGLTGAMLSPGYIKQYSSLLGHRHSPAVIMSVGWTDKWRNADLLGHDGFKGQHDFIATAEQAAAYGADAVHDYVFLGSSNPADDVAEMKRLGTLVRESERLGLPVLCEPLARGTNVAEGEQNRPEFVALAARMAAEAGADIVKVEYTGDPVTFKTVVDSTPVPTVMMGGATRSSFLDFLVSLESAMTAGCSGVAVGRNLYLHERPADAIRAITDVICKGRAAQDAAKEYNL
ncbi:class I fructose-bisphosphate aldolase [Vibrio penaeicida]|uniref:Aldolase n=1 Tax=Vibrio penaeicida TaxID=104609 RepID=A0AAV5NXZ4_9VIBR|nr:hypothetical protein [Vibrio penaeicida]RTZ21559.1 hypothetical protein EKN09_18830 [Vibrio penaeicida]GLQ75258.1 aldolase [Vibrio penaeicida]